MELYVDKLIQELPDGLADEIPIKFYSSDKIAVLRAQNVFSEQRSFDSYKFFLPYSPDHPDMVINKKQFTLEKDKFFALNPGQEHGFTVDAVVPDFNAIFIDKEYMRRISRYLFGVNEIYFKNKSNKITLHLYQLFNKFIFECNNKHTGYELVLQGLNIQIIVNLLREMDNSANNKTPRKNKFHDQEIIDKVINYLYNNYRESFTLNDLAAVVNYSPFHLIRIFKRETGKTPFEYLQDIKIKKAEEMLRNTDKSITDICFEAGFNNRSYFSTFFKKKKGVTPSEFREVISK